MSAHRDIRFRDLDDVSIFPIRPCEHEGVVVQTRDRRKNFRTDRCRHDGTIVVTRRTCGRWPRDVESH